MRTIRTISLTPASLTVGRGPARNIHRDPSLFIAATLFLAVLIADAVLVAKALPSIAEIGWRSIAST
jgi:hypothetical protein